MTRRPASRRSQLLSDPDLSFDSSYLTDDRNNEQSILEALAAARIEHERVREAAVRVYQLHEVQEKRKQIAEAERIEEERLKAEAQIAAEEKRLQELKAKSIPKPAPPPEPPQQQSQPSPTIKETPASRTSTPQKPGSAASTTPAATPQSTEPSSSKQPNGLFANVNKPAQSSPLSPAGQATKEAPKLNPFANLNGGPVQQDTAPSPLAAASRSTPAAPAAPAAPATPATPQTKPAIDHYSQIHQDLKNLRKNLQAQSKEAGSPLKGKLGSYRREIRVAVGQLTGVKGANAKPINKITTILQESIAAAQVSPPIEVRQFIVDKDRQPVEGAPNNEATMPSLFIYLVNICAKAIINQFINEGGANPKAADPIGVFSAHIFSHKEFLWRGQPLIDILMAKFRMVCPVLFGFRGNDKTERGRMNLGWRKDGPSYISEQSHNDRMTGLGAGYASLSLRDFSRSAKTNPFPPPNYWKALAGIVNSPEGQVSNTQFVVLRAMIEGHAQRFINFYGNAAIAALRLALIEFPKKAPANASAAGSLTALADMLRSEEGLVFD